MRAAKTVADLLEFETSNLRLQKLLYLSHMFHLGTTGEPLIDGHFEAWDLGAIEPDIYNRLKAYGSDNIKDVFPYEGFPKGSPEYQSIFDVVSAFRNWESWRLVGRIHEDGGAWAKNYRPGVWGVRIPDKDILVEYIHRSAIKPEGKDT